MRIIVVLRLVPDLSGEFSIAEDGRSIDREWVDMKLNEFDDYALEESVLLKETSGAFVTAIALEGEGTDRMLQTALARGTDRAVKVKLPNSEDPSGRSLAFLFAAAVEKLGADLVLTGVQTPEDIHGQLAPFLGATLGWPCASAVNSVKIDGDGVLAQQEFSGGVSATLRLALPAVIGVQTASLPIRYVAGSKLRQMIGQEIDTIDTEAEMASRDADLVHLAVPDKTGSAVMLDGDPTAIAGKIYRLLVERSLVKA